MATRNWNLDALKSQLSSRKEVKGWIVTQEHVHRRERYFLLDSTALVPDQDREVRAQSITAKIIVKLAKPGRQGEITKKLFPALALAPQIDSAIASALQTDHQAWDLPAHAPTDIPQRASTDPKMAEDLESVVGEMTHEIGKAVATRRSTLFNSAELFLSVHDREFHLSNGLIHRASQSRVYVETAYSFSRKNDRGQMESDEYLNTRWAVNRSDLAIGELFTDTSDRAEHSLDVEKPGTAKYAVIVDADVLATLFNDQTELLMGSHAYHGLPFVKPGDEIIPQATGDLITMTLDPTLEYGGDTSALSEQGVIQKPLKLIDKNRVLATITDKQYADYLSQAPTTTRGDVVIDGGTLSHAELTQQAPIVLEILQFSGLFSDPNTGTFSSEIRLGKLYDNTKGTVKYVKGGSLSGSIAENFKLARFSRNRVKRATFTSGSMVGHGYFGPEHAFLTEVSIVG